MARRRLDDGTFASEHGAYGTRAHNSWRAIRDRCLTTTHKAWPRYGGRGVVLCERWHSFENFYADMGNPPDGCSIDRIDNDGGYSPDNCRWATRTEQARNRKSSRLLTHDGRTQTLAAWADESGINQHAIAKRLARGWDAARSLTAKLRGSTSPI